MSDDVDHGRLRGTAVDPREFMRSIMKISREDAAKVREVTQRLGDDD